MYICEICWDKYYEPRYPDYLYHNKSTNLCEICNQYKELRYCFSGTKPKNKWPKLARRKLKRMFVGAKVPECLFDDSVLGQPAKDVIKAIAKLIRDAENVGYTCIRFEQMGDYDGSWYEACGVRPETDIEMRRRFKEIRRHKKPKKKK